MSRVSRNRKKILNLIDFFECLALVVVFFVFIFMAVCTVIRVDLNNIVIYSVVVGCCVFVIATSIIKCVVIRNKVD